MRFVSSNANASGRPFSMYATLLIASPLRVDVCKWGAGSLDEQARTHSRTYNLTHRRCRTGGVNPTVDPADSFLEAILLAKP